MDEFIKQLMRGLELVSQNSMEEFIREQGYDPDEVTIFATCRICGAVQTAEYDSGVEFVCPVCGSTEFIICFEEEEREEEEDEEEIIAKGRECFGMYLKETEQQYKSIKKKVPKRDE